MSEVTHSVSANDMKKNSYNDIEKKADVVVVLSSARSLILGEEFEQEKRLNRGLNLRQIQMLTLVGVFGTGLFLSSGTTLYLTGNVGMFLSFLIVGFLVGFNQLANIEISCLAPLTGAAVRQTEIFIDEAYGFAYGWIQVYASALPGELAATAVIMQYWSDLNPAVWLSVFIVIIVAFNSYDVHFYGEVEFVFGVLKILLILGLIILCIVIDLGGVDGGKVIGFRYWKDTPFKAKYSAGNLGKFLAFWKSMYKTVYSYGGISVISFFGGETQNPRRAIYTAGKRIFYRVFLFYMLTVFGLTLILSADNPKLATSTGDATGSPFVIAIKAAGIKGLPSVINALVLLSAFSAANLSLVSTSRNLFALASKNQAPKIFLKTNKRGLPYYGVICAALVLPISYMSSSSGSSTVFDWFQDLSSANLLIGWSSIALAHIAMQRALKAQGYSRQDLPYTLPFADWGAYISFVFFMLMLFTGGFNNFLKDSFSISDFFSDYFSIAFFSIFFIFWKFWKKTKLLKPEEVDLQSLFDNIEANPEDPPEKITGWRYITLLWA